MRVTLDVEILNKVLSYLGQRPFVEVAQLIKDVHDGAKEIKEPATDMHCVSLSAENI